MYVSCIATKEKSYTVLKERVELVDQVEFLCCGIRESSLLCVYLLKFYNEIHGNA